MASTPDQKRRRIPEPPRVLTPEAKRALAEAEERRRQAEALKDEAASELKARMGERLEVQYGPDKRERITYKVIDRKPYSVKATTFRMLRVFGAEE